MFLQLIFKYFLSCLWSFIMNVYVNFQIMLDIKSLILFDPVFSHIFVDMSRVNGNQYFNEE